MTVFLLVLGVCAGLAAIFADRVDLDWSSFSAVFLVASWVAFVAAGVSMLSDKIHESGYAMDVVDHRIIIGVAQTPAPTVTPMWIDPAATR